MYIWNRYMYQRPLPRPFAPLRYKSIYIYTCIYIVCILQTTRSLTRALRISQEFDHGIIFWNLIAESYYRIILRNQITE